jgi:glycosyltransferase involved in cell wall biosynthesis
MASGTPVLTSADVATADLAGDAVATALLDSVSLADGIRHVLDPVVAARLRSAGSKLVTRFSWSAAADRHVDAYRAASGRAATDGVGRGR